MPVLPAAVWNGNRFSSLSGSLVQVTGSVTPQLALPANNLRVGVYFYNDSNSTVSLAAGFTADTSRCTIRIPASSSLQVPLPPYWGPWAAIWQTSPTTGNLLVTEFV
jgi:hypothetical protein